MEISGCDQLKILKEILEAKAVVVGSPTVNGSMFQTISAFLRYVTGLKPKGKIWAVFGSYGWGGGAVRAMTEHPKTAGFEVLEPGLVDELMLRDQIVLRGEIRLQLLRELADQYNLDFLITGRVEGFSPQRGSVEETHPEFEFGARQLDASTGKILATYDGNTSGADSETILGLGRCHSLGELVARSFKGLRKTIRKESERRFE